MHCVQNIVIVFVVVTGHFVARHATCRAGERSPQGIIVIALQPNVQADNRVIQLADVAKITGGDAALREKLKELDIEDPLEPGEILTILPAQIEFRLRVAGINLDQVTIRGTEVRVTGHTEVLRSPRESIKSTAATGKAGARPLPTDKPWRGVDFGSISDEGSPLELEIVQAAKTCILGKLPWPVENVDIRLAQPLTLDARRIGDVRGYEILAELRSSGPPVGRVQVRVVVHAQNKPILDLPVQFDVRHFDKIALTTKAIERGHVIVASDVYIDRQDVTELSEYSSTANELIGLTAKRSLRGLAPLRTTDVEGKNRTETAVLIKRREQVKMVARLGALNVTAMGEALQDGRVGEVIRLRNIESNANVQGRVVASGEVEISF